MNITGSAKALIPDRCVGDEAANPADGHQWLLGLTRVTHRHQGADHGRLAVGDVLHLLQQGAHIVGVAFLIAKSGRIVGGLHLIVPPKCVHTQTNIVGNGWQAPRVGWRVGLWPRRFQ